MKLGYLTCETGLMETGVQMTGPERWEVLAGGVLVGEPDKALLLSWWERSTRPWVVGKQVEPGLWTSSAGAADARTEFVSLRRLDSNAGGPVRVDSAVPFLSKPRWAAEFRAVDAANDFQPILENDET